MNWKLASSLNKRMRKHTVVAIVVAYAMVWLQYHPIWFLLASVIVTASKRSSTPAV
jgi:hypothetical protein